MELTQGKTLFERPREAFSSGKKPSSGMEENRDAATGLDSDIREMLADYLKRYSADDSIIEIKGKLIRYIRSI